VHFIIKQKKIILKVLPSIHNGNVATLVLGLRPKQGVVRLRAKRRSLGVKGSVRE